MNKVDIFEQILKESGVSLPPLEESPDSSRVKQLSLDFNKVNELIKDLNASEVEILFVYPKRHERTGHSRDISKCNCPISILFQKLSLEMKI